MVVASSFPVEERYELGKLVTFVPNKKAPIHNWFIFKEGFSRDFVLLMLDELKVRKNALILDPFCGVGTTLSTAKEVGIDAVGVDVAPLQVFITQVKIADYDIEGLKEVARDVFSKKFMRPGVRDLSPLVRRAFSKYSLEDIIFFREEIRSISDPKIKNFFTLALMEAANRVTYAYKNGAVIKMRERPTIPLRKAFKGVVKRMIRDLKKMSYKGSKVKVYLGDVRRMAFLPDERFDAIITSPPYLNRIDYTKVYSIEYELFFDEVRVDSVRSYIGLSPKGIRDPFPELNLPEVAKAYFQDMKDALDEIHRVSKDGARCALVVAEGVFPDRVVPTDLLMANLAERTGFSVEKMIVASRRVVTRDRTVKVGRARESVVIMKKAR